MITQSEETMQQFLDTSGPPSFDEQISEAMRVWNLQMKVSFIGLMLLGWGSLLGGLLWMSFM